MAIPSRITKIPQPAIGEFGVIGFVGLEDSALVNVCLDIANIESCDPNLALLKKRLVMILTVREKFGVYPEHLEKD